MPRDVARYVLTILVPLRLLLTLPAPGVSVPADSQVREASRNHLPSAHQVQARPHLAAGFCKSPGSPFTFEADEFSEEEEASDLITILHISSFDDRASTACRLECWSPQGERQPSRTFPLRC